MLKRLSWKQAALAVETALVGLFFVQALRYVVAALYSGFGSASLVAALDPATIPAGTPGALHPAVFSNQASFVLYMLALPLLGLVLRRLRWPLVIAAGLTAAGRALMLEGTLLPALVASALTVGGGLLYLALLIRQRAQLVPLFFILALGVDQLLRAFGNTLDPSWSAAARVVDVLLTADTRLVVTYVQVQVFLSVLALVLSLLNWWGGRRGTTSSPQGEAKIAPDYGLLTAWGAVGMGALMFLQLSLLALPNAIAGRANADYTTLVPFTLAATLLPLVPGVRNWARGFIGLFDNQWRGWLWAGLIAFLLVFGTRVQYVSADLATLVSNVVTALGLPPVRQSAFNFFGAFLLVIGQFCASLLWWWMARPQAEKERNLSGLWIVLGVLVFATLAFFDVFTYEYAYVRNLPAQFDLLNNTVIPLLRGFRGMGLLVLLLAILLAGVPMIQTQRRIAWGGEKSALRSLAALVVVAGCALLAAFAARPPLVQGVRNVDSIRIGSYNIHWGYNEFYYYDLEAIAQTIEQSGANVVLLQMIEAGRMTSFGVDQPLWLARRLGMDVRFFSTNEGLQGLAVLSNVEIVFADGNLLTSQGSQTGVQRVQIRPDEGVITLYNTWLGFLTETAGTALNEQEQDQQRQLSEIFTLIRLHHPDGNFGRMVLGGTFNNVPDSPLIQRMRDNEFSDPFAGLPLELAATLLRTRQAARIDYLWLRSLVPWGSLVVDSRASDHGLLVVGVFLER